MKLITITLALFFTQNIAAQVQKLLAAAKPITKEVAVGNPADKTITGITSWQVVTDKSLSKWVLAQANVENDIEKVVIRIAGKTALQDKRIVVYYAINGILPGEGSKAYLFAMVLNSAKTAVLANNDITEVAAAMPLEGTPTCINKKFFLQKDGTYKTTETCTVSKTTKQIVAYFSYDDATHLPLQRSE